MSKENLKRSDIIFEQYGVKYKVFDRVIEFKSSELIIKEIIDSGLKGRGGAGFPTGLKWKFAAQQQANEKFVICNADEGEPGTFKDREILLQVPRKVLSGMGICAKAIGAKKGIIYLRGEYEFMFPELQAEIDFFNEHAQKAGLDFSVFIRLGSGAYVCGEETALIESIEGKRGEPRNKPPFPVVNGLMDKPTVINNVETFVNVVLINKLGVEQFNNLGTSDSRGSKLFSVSGDTKKAGVYELELGMKLSDFVDEFGDGDTKAVQVGGASGHCVPRRDFDKTIIGFEGIPTGGSMMLFNSTRSMYNILHNFLDFFEEESCGQCTPCRVGTQQLRKGIEAVKTGERSCEYIEDLIKLTDTMKLTAKCGLGQSVGNSFNSIIKNFREEMLY